MNGKDAVLGETPVFAHDSVTFKINGLSDGQSVKFGDDYIAADGNGVYNVSMPYADRSITITDEGGGRFICREF